eukprot:358196-Pyramimonas_sp.AAC.2
MLVTLPCYCALRASVCVAHVHKDHYEAIHGATLAEGMKAAHNADHEKKNRNVQRIIGAHRDWHCARDGIDVVDVALVLMR